jgi:hypothetical protein
MARAVEMPCPLKVLRHIENKEGLHPGSLVEEGMVHGNLAWSLSDSGISLAVADEHCEVVYKVGVKTVQEWVDYFSMSCPQGVRVLNINDFRTVLSHLRDVN